MLASFALVAISLLLRTPQSDAQFDGVEAPEFMEFEAVLKSVAICPGADGDAFSYKVLNPKLNRVSSDVVELSCDLEITKEIPDSPSYTIETTLESVSETDESERFTVASVVWPNVCGDLASADKESYRTFRESVEGDFLCPVAPEMAAILVLANVLILSQLAFAGIGPLDDEVDVPFDFEAVLKAVYKCEGTNYDNHWENCTYSRVSPETVLLSMNIVIGKEIPNDPTYMAKVEIENQPNDNPEERILVATVTATNICKELANEDNESVQDFLSKVDGDLTCPIEKGVYKATGVEMSVKKVKPLLREGLMFFTVTQYLQSKPIACHVAEFIITLE